MLVWTEPEDSNDDSQYTHVMSETPMGRIIIEWKGWKDHPDFDIKMPWDEHLVDGNLESLKVQVQEAWDKMAAQMTAQMVPGGVSPMFDLLLAAHNHAKKCLALGSPLNFDYQLHYREVAESRLELEKAALVAYAASSSSDIKERT